MSKKRKFGFIGTGAWSSALANVLVTNGHEVMMYGINKDEIQAINNGNNYRYFGSSDFNDKELISATNDLKELVSNSNTIVLGIPSKSMKVVLKHLQKNIKYRKIDIINLSKGIEPNSELLFSEFIKKRFKGNLKNLATFIGPSYASEVFQNELTMINIVSDNQEYMDSLVKYFNNSYFKLIPSTNVIGAEMFAALKNVLAIGLGIISYKHSGKNTQSAMLTIGINEILKIYQSLYPNDFNIFAGLDFSGIGDVILTCTSDKSRNFTLGYEIAEFGLKSTLEKNKTTIEGFETAKTLDKLLKKHEIEAPFFASIIEVILKGKNPFKITDFLTNSKKY
ncbi:glycerol-3-phosphate dehydrogenase [Mycoplasma sp. NEAQ87857]|uniref:NAD(P)H-dependent glycerol-3-phosphate dehydrogenase n=1 Tax=Mycoplasma sp. NEAQ87857 TaxID=2683967 RepID=UPI001318FDE6|nr:NAD(P)H-dependent glycerol-3-phosphate dehydrogenase [Mycoplasma sp. NEAQ87857]QGZ97949.1 glycerol-3-phosphate dehydrogenase [Mycoplasma sp. NEAQ87857]